MKLVTGVGYVLPFALRMYSVSSRPITKLQSSISRTAWPVEFVSDFAHGTVLGSRWSEFEKRHYRTRFSLPVPSGEERKEIE